MIPRFLVGASLVFIISGFSIIASNIYLKKNSLISPLATEVKPKPLPYLSYSIENLKTQDFKAQDFIISDKISDNDNYSAYLAYLSDKVSTVSGLLNLPKINRPHGLIILLRGYVDRQIYQTGVGTKRIGEKLAANGFLTLAPDFLGYGRSSSASAYPLEERFQTYTSVLSLIASVPNIIIKIQQEFPTLNLQTASLNLGLFGHSNGGQIALAILEITGSKIPTVLWAPVSKPFPFSVLAYTDEFEDHGRALRKLLADFEKDYDISKYSIDQYFDFINAPLQIHQGLADQEVPYWWSDELVQILKNKSKYVEYFKYPLEDHNFNGGTWDSVANRTVNFYLERLSAP